MNNVDAAMVTVTCMAFSAQLWGQGLPERSTVASWAPTAESVARVNEQSLYSGGASLLVAAGASFAVRSWWPILGAALTVAYLGGTYAASARQGAAPPRAPQPPEQRSIRWIP
jgi:hypothetical protein